MTDRGLRVVACTLLVCALFCPALSIAQTVGEETVSKRRGNWHTDPESVGFDSVPQLQNRPRSDFENSLMSEFACTCGDCKLELINGCRCAFAAKMRGELMAQLDGLDLSTESARRKAAETVRASFIASYGAKVLDRTNRLDPSGRIAGFVVVTIVLSIFTVTLGRRVMRRRATQGRKGA